jgi:alanine racemase
MAVVKDDAYGHGLDRIIPVALQSGVKRFAVLDIPTGLHVRELVAQRDVQLFAWLFDHRADFGSAIDANIDLGVSNRQVLDAIAAAGATRAARIHLKIDTGLHRNGCPPELWPDLVAHAVALQDAGVIDVIGIWSHIGEASDEDDAKSRAVFIDACDLAIRAGLNIRQQHLSASAASFDRPDFRFSFSRVGGFSYGVAPGDGIGPADLGLEPVMSATADVINVSSTEGMRVATLDAGFVDGIPDWVVRPGQKLQLPQAGFDVSVRGTRSPVLSVDAQTMTVDVTHIADIAVGDVATIFGSHFNQAPVLQEIADAIGTVGEEIVVRVGPRNEREYVD